MSSLGWLRKSVLVLSAIVALLLSAYASPALAGTADEVGLLPTVDPLNRSESPLSNGGKWTTLNWATNSGQDTTGGWGPASAFPTVTGAYWNPGAVDGRYGDAAALTMQTAPGISERYVSIWLNMPSPGSAKSGYQLRWTTNAETSKYTVKLSKWVAGTETVLASSPAVSIPTGTTLAIADTGGTVSAWRTEGGTTFTSLLSASDSTYESGYAGLEGAGNISRSTNFKAGPLLGAAAAGSPVLDNLERSEVPLATGKWTKTNWAPEIGGAWMGGYRGYGSNGGLAGAYWNSTAFSDSSGGALVAATVGTGATPAGQYLGLWLGMPAPGSARSGYEARFTGTNGTATAYKVELSKWAAGTRTVLATKEGFSLAVGTTLALSDSGTGVVLWTGSGGGLAPLLTATDSTYGSGYAGLEVNGGAGTVYNFRAASLGQAPETTINSGPSGSVLPQNVSFAFSSTPSGASFECSLDGVAFAACASPKAYPAINPGPHAFRVRATNSAGTDPTPAERGFTVIAPPAATTKDAIAVKDNGATLNAEVNPNGAATTYQFEWGTSTGYGNVAPASAKSAGSGSAAVEVSEALSGITPNTEYHYRVSATNANGNSKGADKTFFTTDKPAATTKVATEVSATGATLRAEVNPNGAATTYYFEYGPTLAYGSKAPAAAADAGSGRAAVVVGEPITGLTEGTTYHYRVVATNEIGTSTGGDQSLTTPLLAEVETEGAEAVNANEAILTGTIDPNGEGTTYQFEYGTTTAYGAVAPEAPEEAAVGSGPESAEEALAFLAPETTYHYRLVATSEAGRVVGPDRTLTTTASSVTPQREQQEREEELHFTGALLEEAIPADFTNLHWSGDTPYEVEPFRMEAIRRSGAAMLRLGVGLGGVNELLFERSAKRGITILPGLGGNHLPPRDQWDEWRANAEAIVNRYGKGGTFWAEKGLPQTYAPVWWEIWNEPNIEKNGIDGGGPKNGDVNPVVFGEFLEEAAAGVRAADPNAKVLLGGLLSTKVYEGKPGEEIHRTPVEFIQQMGHQGAYDAVGLHPYAFKVEYQNSTPQEPREGPPLGPGGVEDLTVKIRANVKKVREALDGLPGTAGNNKLLWINEIGWPTENPWDPANHAPVSPAIQRDMLVSTISMLKAKSNDWSIRNVFIYNTQDWNQQQSWDYRSGLQWDRQDPKFKPSWYAFLKENEMPEWPKRPKNARQSTTVKPKKFTARSLINPYGSPTRFWVKWGQGPSSPSYGNFTTAQSAGFEEGDVERAVEVAGLTPKETYHYRIVAENENGEKEETDDVQFTTPPSSSISADDRRKLHGQPGYVWIEGWVKEGTIVGPDSGPGLQNVHVHVKLFRNGQQQKLVDVMTDNQGHYETGYIQVGKGHWTFRADFPGGMEWDPAKSPEKDFDIFDGVLIKAKHSNNCLDVEGGWFADGVRVMHGACHGEANQVFTLQPKGNGQYLEIIARHSGKCLDVGWASQNDGEQIVQHACNGGSNEAFREEWWGTTPYTSYVAQHSSKCLDVANGALGWASLQQWGCNGSEQQRFSLVPVESGPIPTETTMEVDQVLHGSPGLMSFHGWLKAGPYGMGGRVVHLQFDNASAGGWSTIYDVPVTVAADGSFEYRDYGIQPGYYNVRAYFAGNSEFKTSQSGEHFRTVKRGYQIIARHSGRCLSLSENKNVNGQRFLQWDCGAPVNGNGQVFSFWEPQGSNWYQLRANGTNRCVDVINVSGANGAGLQLWDCLGGGQTNQHWRREPIQGQSGWFGLMPRHVFPSKCLDVSGAGTGNGVLYHQWDCHWGGNQQFELRGVIDP